MKVERWNGRTVEREAAESRTPGQQALPGSTVPRSPFPAL